MTKLPNILSDVAHLKGGYAFKSSDYTPSGRFILRTVNITDDGRIDRAGATFISEKDAEEYSNFELEDGDTLFVMVGATLGKVGLVTANDLPALLNQNMWVIRAKDPDVTCKRYLNYWFKDTVKRTMQWASGSARGFVTRDDYRSLPFPSVMIETQRQIAQVLVALDAKIELNQRINEELEGMAKLLYDYWFVQYDFPMSAAQAAALGKPHLTGHPYRASGGPMTYHETLKREIPKGWEVSTIGDTFRTHLGGTPSRKEPSFWNPGEITWLSSGEKEQLFVCAPDEKISRDGLANSAATLLPEGSVILSIVRHIRASILGIDAATNQSVLGIRETEFFKHSFIYPFIVREIPRYMMLRTGAQQPHINKETVDTTSFVLPDQSVLKAYTAIAQPLFDQIKVLQTQTQELTTLRDWLLPMLMNGQVTVG